MTLDPNERIPVEGATVKALSKTMLDSVDAWALKHNIPDNVLNQHLAAALGVTLNLLRKNMPPDHYAQCRAILRYYMAVNLNG